MLRQIATIGPETRQWSESMTAARGVEGVRVLVGLKALAGKHPAADLERACQLALSHGAYRPSVDLLLTLHAQVSRARLC